MTSRNEKKVEDLLYTAGRLFAKMYPVVNDHDQSITFSVNAETCYQQEERGRFFRRMWRIISVVITFGFIAIAVTAREEIHSAWLNAATVTALMSIVFGLTFCFNEETAQTVMYQQWKKERDKLYPILRRRIHLFVSVGDFLEGKRESESEKMNHPSECTEDDSQKEYLKSQFAGLAQGVANNKVLYQRGHPKKRIHKLFDKEKMTLQEVSSILGITIRWIHHFDTATEYYCRK